jgi:hypothetical protein
MTKNISSKTYALSYHSCRNISAPEDEQQNRKVYSGHAPTSSVLALEDDENVREYLVNAKGKQRQKPTLVHLAIRKTLQEYPDQFSVLNGGMVVVAKRATVDDGKKIIHLEQPSIINGSQTQGELKRYFESANGNPEYVPSIRYEIIVTENSDLIAEISIARNFQNDVRTISIAGSRGQLDELELAMQSQFPDSKLRKSESDIISDDEFLDTEKLIQVTLALMPADMIGSLDDKTDNRSKVFTYSQKTRCLKMFQRMVEDVDNQSYRCALSLAPIAWKLYLKWKCHQGFQGSGLRAIERDGRNIVEVPDGMVFPIIAAYSAFVSKAANNEWKLSVPPIFKDTELITAAKQAYMEIADSNPQTMGKKPACYSNLFQIASIYAKLSQV